MVDRSNLPALYQAADDASVSAQRTYLRLVRIDLAALVLGALLTVTPASNPPLQSILAGTGTFLLIVGVFLTLAISLKNYEDTWYGGRAMAESIKTLAWKYMARAHPFDPTDNIRQADRTFSQHLREILSHVEQLAVPVGGDVAAEQQVTDTMREVRGLSLPERKEIYRDDRIREQRVWYSKKSSQNETAERRLFCTVLLAQLLAVAAGILSTLSPSVSFGIVGVFSAAAAALIAWLQVQRHQELAQAYGIAAQELGVVSSELRHIESDDQFASFVADSEAAISREHTLWAARRGVPLRGSFRRRRP